MTPERYQRICQLFDEALELAPEQRATFLDEACGADVALRAEVEKFLAGMSPAEDYLARPAMDVAAELLAHKQQNPSALGQQISHYQVLSLLGAGGMGQVYLARDTRLGRQVALKLLPPQFTPEVERVQRFLREAQAASALNHPNILTIYDVGQAQDLYYIATEYVEGMTLRQRLLQDKLTLHETLDIARQIARALESAHRAGIVHRDIKPENIMIRADGLVKVLDFGLAKLTETRSAERGTRKQEDETPLPDASDIHRSLFREQPSTMSGTVMGTPRYMSPEQARGLKLDARTDIFSLGVVFYEMVTGEPAFAGPSTAEVFVALLEKEPPPLRQFIPEVPDSLQVIINQMLAKERDQRYSSMRDFLDALAQLDVSTASGSKERMALPSTVTRGNESSSQQQIDPASVSQTVLNSRLSVWRGQRLKWLVIMLVSVVGFAGYRWLTARPTPMKQSFAEARFMPLIGEPGRKNLAAISPDDSRVAFAWDGGAGAEVSPTDIYVKVIGTDGPPLRLTTAPENDTNPFWTPDGKYVTFVRELPNGKGDVLRVPASGGPEQKLAETYSWAAWSPDGKTLAIRDIVGERDKKSLFLFRLETGTRNRLTTPEPNASDSIPRFSPDGKWVAFTRQLDGNVGDIFVVPVSGGTPRQLTFEQFHIFGRLAWTSDSREIVFSAVRREMRGLWRVPAQGGTLTRVTVNARNPINPDVARQGDKLVFTDFANDSNLWLYQGAGFAGRESPGKFGAPVKLPTSSLYEDQSPVFSPDGQTIVFVSERSGVMELWTCDAEGKPPARQLTRAGDAGSPRWSYDGKWLAVDSSADGDLNIYVMSAAGDSPWRRLTFEKSSESQPAWSRDGQWIYFRSNRAGSSQIYKMPATGGEIRQITFNGGYEGYESPDGKLFYYSKGRGVNGIYLVPVNGGEEKLVPELKDAGYWRSWMMVNEGICFTAKKSESEWAIRLFSFATRRITPLVTLSQAPLWYMPGLAMSSDGRRLLFAQLEHPYDEIMLMENFH